MQPHSSNNTRTTPSNVTDCHLARKPNEANNVAKVTAVSSLAGKKGGKNIEAPLASAPATPPLRQKQWPSKAAVDYHFVRVCCVLFAAGMQTHAPLGHTRQSWGVLGKRLKNWMDGPPR